eukprot:TRINITY_DN44521_c0_g1_i1.p1 TRINITY_DN44521_c0_g1~~TRINITY_DN44521_c0_g1_i1.p1  ORF type:complete len:293 (+),score=42.24 TRINITY_DN44521_c0_g1_i1:95-880(+)
MAAVYDRPESHRLQWRRRLYERLARRAGARSEPTFSAEDAANLNTRAPRRRVRSSEDRYNSAKSTSWATPESVLGGSDMLPAAVFAERVDQASQDPGPANGKYGALLQAAAERYTPLQQALPQVLSALNADNDSGPDVSDVEAVPECDWLYSDLNPTHPMHHVANTPRVAADAAARHAERVPGSSVISPEDLNAYLVAHAIEQETWAIWDRDARRAMLKEVYSTLETEHVRTRLLRHSLTPKELVSHPPGEMMKAMNMSQF